MTSLVSWVSVDSRGPAALYIATDSRFSFSGGRTWDHGRKVFASRGRPEVFAFVGQVLFPCVVLSQLADAGTQRRGPAAARDFHCIQNRITELLDAYPPDQRHAFAILHAIRIGKGMDARFQASSVRWDQQSGWDAQEEVIPGSSDTVVVWGSGGASVEKWKARWSKTEQGGTSRAVFAAFCDAVASSDDPKSGGVPQIVALYRQGAARSIGFVDEQGPHHLGIPTSGEPAVSTVDQWRNRLFERCAGDGRLLEGAQAHRSPKGLGRRQR